MNNEKKIVGNSLYSLIPLDDFKALMGVDDRDDKTARFCLLTATLTIEQYCKRKFLRKKYIEISKLNSDLLIPLREYPVTEIIQVRSESEPSVRLKIKNEGRGIFESVLIDPVFYRPMIGNGFNEELPFELLLSPSLRPYCYTSFKVIYWAGYKNGSVPADLAAACMELASWNMNRYRGKRIGMSGNIRGAGILGTSAVGEHFELSMPENVRLLLEPYRRKTI